ncbi:MAG: HAD family acid phosphatase [Croceibacterium sp.]
MKRIAFPALSLLALGACVATPPPAPMAAPAAAQTTDDQAIAVERIKPFQYLYGSGEAAAVSIQTYHALIGFARAQVAARPADSVILADGSTLAAPHFVPCGDKPFAAVFDVDETVILNLGLEARAAAGESTGGGMLDRWAATGANAVAPVPGAVYAIDALRQMGVTVIFNTNRGSDTADGTAAAIAAAGLGRAVHGETLFLSGDDAMGGRKDGRRWTVAAKYCVIAMGGDQLGDFSDLFNVRDLPTADRRRAASSAWAAQLWGSGWFMLPNPAYGPSLKGTIDQIFPADKRWTDGDGSTK